MRRFANRSSRSPEPTSTFHLLGARQLCLVSCAAVLALAGGCKTAQTPAPATTTASAGCPTGSATGTWTGTGVDSTGHWTFTADFKQQGTKISGVFHFKNTDNGSKGDDHVAGTVQCSDGSYTYQTVKLSGASGEISPTHYKGKFTNGFTKFSGTWDVASGTYQGSKT